MKEKGFLIGTSSFDNMIICNEIEPYIQASYIVIIDKRTSQKYIGEITDCYIQPYMNENNLPEGIDFNFFENKEKHAFYFAKIKILNTTLNSNIEPNSLVYEPNFDDLKSILFQTEIDEGFNLGIIKGTEYLQSSLPKEISNITPLLKRDDKTKEYHSIKQEGIPYIYNFRSMAQNPHIGLFGSSGSGKSQALKVLEEECAIKRIPFICFDPHNELSFQDFRDEVEKINPKLKKDFKNCNEIFEIGKDIGICFEQLSFQSLVSLFGFFEGGLSDSQKNVLQLLFEEGMKLNVLKYKTQTLLSAFMKKENERNHRKVEFTSDEQILYDEFGSKIGGMETIRAFSWRLNNLENKGIFTLNIQNVISCIQKRKGAIIRGNTELLRVVGYYLISELYQKRIAYKEYHGEPIPPFLIFIDEAHNFAPENGISYPTKNLLRTLGLESRKYGVFLCLATQRPSNLDKTLLTQINNKFLFRIIDSNDISALETECNLTKREISCLPNLKAGNCYLALSSQEKKFFIRFRCTFTLDVKGENPFDELIEEQLSKKQELILKFSCINTIKSNEVLEFLEDNNINLTVSDLIKECDILESKGFLKKEKSMMGTRYLKTEKEI